MSDMSQNCLTRSFWAVAALCAALHTTHAQDYSMSIEITGEHTGMVGEVDLTGHTTYQFSLNLADPADQVLTVFGNTENPTEIVAPAGYFNSLYASGPTAAGISTEGLALYPSLSFDSYVTIGLEHEPDLGAGESFIIVNEDLDQQWVSNLFFPSATSGESIYMNTETGGSWFALPGATNAIAGDDMQVLIAQFTSEDCLHGVLHALILPADGSPAFVLGQQFNCTECGPIGCADETACNYNPDAPNYPGGNANCTYADDGYDCDGNCLLDSDLDGICDPFEVAGCTDASALNFDPNATDENGYCVYAEDLNCADEAACNYQPFAGPAYCLQIEPYAEHSGMIGSDDLTGHTTYRIYALCENVDDFVSSVSGDSEFPTRIQSTTSFFQSGFGGLTGSDQNAALFGFFPSAAFDSYITIGLTESAGAGEGNINTIDNPNNPWGELFEDGGDLTIDDEIGGSWFIFNGNTNGIAGDDFRVLLAQVTTDGDLSGSMYVQFFENGSPADDTRQLIDFQQACYGPEELAACEYPDPLLDCDGNCLNDADGDGICDEFEVPGCDDATACNFDTEATDNDGSCDYPANGYDCDGNCLADADGDGVCDEFEVAGCTDAAACNYNADATDDDGSCAELDECGVCGGDGIAEGACDCEGNGPEAGYDCDGNCIADVNNDGLCDIEGCTILEACNYNPLANLLVPEDCIFPVAEGYECYEVVEGCTDATAVNYNPFASVDDGSCVTVVVGCMIPSACTYDPNATVMDFSMCVFGFCDGAGTPLPEGMLTPGCLDPNACNYDENASEMDWTLCDYSCLIGCDNEFACNYSPEVLYNDGSCDFESCVGCMNPLACNFDEGATIPDPSLCDLESCLGCAAPTACNYDPSASLTDFFSCEYCEFDFTGADDYTVQCESDLPTECPEGVTVASTCSEDASEVACLVATNASGAMRTFSATTALGAGPDGAFRLYGAAAQGVADSDFFNEDPANPLELTTYDNGVAVMTGSVISDSNPDQRFDVFVTFEAGQDAAEWEAEDPAHGYLVAFGCEADIETVYTLKGDQSYMVGQGEYAGDLITLSHMPVSENKRFQLGVGGNSHNCNYGFGGWFAWSGTLLNTPAGGMSGDIIVDLEEMAGMPAAVCGQEVTTVFYTAMEESCDYVETHVQTITRVDTMGPAFTSAPEDITVECDAVPAVTALEDLLDSGELAATDNCEATDEPVEYSYDGESINATDCDSQYEILRTWTATDCSGNATSYTQVITVEDMTAPAFVEALPADITAECDAVPAADVLTAIDNCDAAVEVMFNESITNGTCAQTYTVTRIWTVSDCAGNVTEHVQTIMVVDTTAPIIDMEASNLIVECDGAGNSAELEAWLASSGGAEASDACSDVTWSNDFASLSDDCGATGMATVTFTATGSPNNSARYTVPKDPSPTWVQPSRALRSSGSNPSGPSSLGASV